jgi:hypothetical protein
MKPYLCFALHCAPHGDPGHGWSEADACWAEPAAGHFGVVRGFSPEATLLRTDLAAVAARAVQEGFCACWAAAAGPPELRLRLAIAAAEAELRRQAVQPPRPPGASPLCATAELAVLALAGERAWLAHCGCCRIFRRGAQGWQQLTRDHTLAEEEPALASLPQASQITTRRLGLGEAAMPAITSVEQGDGLFLLCTPGLFATLDARPSGPPPSSPEAALAELLASSPPLPEGRCGEWRTALLVGC